MKKEIYRTDIRGQKEMNSVDIAKGSRGPRHVDYENKQQLDTCMSGHN